MSNKPAILQFMLSGLLCFASSFLIQISIGLLRTVPKPCNVHKSWFNFMQATATLKEANWDFTLNPSWAWILQELAGLVYFQKFDLFCFKDSWTMAFAKCAIAKWITCYHCIWAAFLNEQSSMQLKSCVLKITDLPVEYFILKQSAS